MKKINSFIAALLLLAMFTFVVHFVCANNDLRDKTGRFGTWYNTYKDLSYNALSQNLKLRSECHQLSIAKLLAVLQFILSDYFDYCICTVCMFFPISVEQVV